MPITQSALKTAYVLSCGGASCVVGPHPSLLSLVLLCPVLRHCKPPSFLPVTACVTYHLHIYIR